MAGPSVVVRFLGDLLGLQKAASDAANVGQNAAGKMASAFHGVIGTLNQTGVLGPFSGALDGIGTALDTMAAHGKSAGAIMAGVGAGVTGVGVALSVMGSKDQAAHQQLQAAVEATGRSYDDYGAQVDKAIGKQEHYGHTANETEDALRIMTQGMGDPAKALKYLGEASDLAAAKHESLDAAATQLTKTYNGSNRLLKEFGGTTLPKASAEQKALEVATKAAEAAARAQATAHQHLADVQAQLAGKSHLTTAEQIQLRDAQNKVHDADMNVIAKHQELIKAQDNAATSAGNAGTMMDQLGQKLKGQASAAADTFSGKLDALKAHAEDMAAKFGAKYGPAIQVFGVVMATAGALSASGWLWLIAIVAAVAALVAIGVILYKNWDTIWHDIGQWISDLWNWIATHWPLLLPILFGPIGLAAMLIIENFATIKRFVMDAWNWIKDNWPLLLAILTGPIGVATLLIIKNFADIKNFVVGVWQDIYGAAAWFWNATWSVIDGVIRSIEGLPGRLANLGGQMWGWMWDGLQSVLNDIINGWNRTLGSLHFKIPGWVPGLGGNEFGFPTIPGLAAGGIVTAPTLALIGERGPEAVVPLGRGMGPAVHIDNVNLHDGADIDLLLQKIHFATMAGVL
jgi:hypothetical protein